MSISLQRNNEVQTTRVQLGKARKSSLQSSLILLSQQYLYFLQLHHSKKIFYISIIFFQCNRFANIIKYIQKVYQYLIFVFYTEIVYFLKISPGILSVLYFNLIVIYDIIDKVISQFILPYIVGNQLMYQSINC